MDKTTRWIGAFVLALIMIGVPIFTVVSFACGWPFIIRLIGIFITTLETIGLWEAIVERSYPYP